jgi:4-amino-4-deoxy-L-arabinose transferase-like glycosyltransferase
MTERRPTGLWDHLIGFGLGAVYVAILVVTAHQIGYARDEGFYFRAAESYANWFELLWKQPSAALARGAVDAAWAANHEHPALVKSLFALSWKLLYKEWHLFSEEGTSFRFAGMCFAGAGLWLLYIWGSQAKTRTTGLIAALSFALMPRIFYHAHLDCFDVPIATMWTLAAYAYWRSLRDGTLGWAIWAGVAFGLALDTKHNAWFLPVAVVAHTLIIRGRSIAAGLLQGQLRIPLALATMATIGPLVFFALWPWIWFDTMARLTGYVQFHLNHDYYSIVFLGETYWRPPMPRAYAWVMTAATVPTITLVLFGIGVGSRLAAHVRRFVPRWGPAAPRDPAGTDLLWAIGLVISYAPWLSTNTPIFGGTKHWFNAYPFLCLFAGVGFDVVLEKIRPLMKEGTAALAGRAPVFARLPSWSHGVLLGAVVLAAPLAETVHSHPWGLSNYTPLVGGASGAASLGLNRQFWGFTTGAVTDFLNDHVRVGDSVYVHDTAGDSWEMLHRDGRLRREVQAAWAPHQGGFALYHHEEHMEGVEYQIWTAYKTTSPVHIGAYDGVPIVYVYARPGYVRR